MDRALEKIRDKKLAIVTFSIASAVGDFGILWHIIGLLRAIGSVDRLRQAFFDAYAAKDGSGRMKVAGLWLLRGGWVLLTAMLAYQGLHAHALPIGSTPELILSLGWGLTAATVFLAASTFFAITAITASTVTSS